MGSGAKTKVGIIGCGNIFNQYVKGCRVFDILEVAACSDLDMVRAKGKADENSIPCACSVEELLNDPEIQIVVNLTVPKVHAEVSLAAIAAGKNVHSEKPLAVTREEGQRILAVAKARGVLVGCAPDTFLGGGLQTCRKLINDGAIGTPVAATAFFAAHGPEAWHPNPDFFYQVGGGPLFDLGPYYLTALISLLGPVKRVTGSARASFPERIAGDGHHIPVDVPTHIAGTLEFAAGPIASVITSFDVWSHHLPRIEIYGSEGSLSVPDPNTFGGPVQVRRFDEKDWRDVPLTHTDSVWRGIGVADMAYALISGRSHRASGALAYHVVDIMHALLDASDAGQRIQLESTCTQPEPLPVGLPQGQLYAGRA